ncbi:unnamed protein product [Spirodela intermedia]|uniref:Tyrosinase copper-binding domain-containing protein n=1 Tax=Spirodela intermedia TaxID=51605 RepID=A0A7I8JBA9_SPIIN|nr:unnamed protein product [Spirodela intermedia]CAA6667271.1 unnamed protein product [Spirodela intermedia]
MTLPRIFTDPSSSLYDPLRNPAHQPPEVLDMDLGDAAPTPQRQIDLNLSIMYRQMVSNAKTAPLFMGLPYRAGDNYNPGAGSMENSPHGPVHVWVGDPKQPNGENMGVFYAAARDPVFYSHHANVDRMWQVWKKLSPRNVDFADRDWLDTSFLFYDEDGRLVRVKVKDCLEPEMLGFTYQEVNLPWLSKRATPRATPAAESRAKLLKSAGGAATFPLTLSSVACITVKRPKISRRQADKDKEEEILVVDGIEFDRTNCVKFDVYVDDTDAGEVKPDDSEFAGSFFNVPHGRGHKKKGKMETMTTTLRLGITDLLEDLKLDDDDEILVTLIPRKGRGKVKIGGVRIELSS